MTPAHRFGDDDLHGNAPDNSPIALLIIDAIRKDQRAPVHGYRVDSTFDPE